MARISKEERLRRHRSNETVIGTHAMEGLHLDGPTLDLLCRFEQGKLNREQLSAAIDLHVQQLLSARCAKPEVAMPAAAGAD